MVNDPKGGLTDEQAADLLTDEELAGMNDPNLVDDETPIIAEHEQADDAAAAIEQPDPELDAAGKPAADAPAIADEDKLKAPEPGKEPPAAAPAPAPSAVPPAAVVDPAAADDLLAALPEPVLPAAPRIFELPAGTNERLTEVAQQIEAISAKFDDGDLNAVELRTQLRPLQEEERKLQRAIDRAAESAEETAAYAKDYFLGYAVPKFLRENTGFADEVVMTIFDQEVRKLQAKDMTKEFDPANLDAAAKTTAAFFARKGIDVMKKGAAPAPAAGIGKRPAPAPSLAFVPAAAQTEVGAAKFAHLDRLTGEAHEDALAALSEADREEYLMSG